MRNYTFDINEGTFPKTVYAEVDKAGIIGLWSPDGLDPIEYDYSYLKVEGMLDEEKTNRRST